MKTPQKTPPILKAAYRVTRFDGAEYKKHKFSRDIGTGNCNSVFVDTNLWGRQVEISIFAYHFQLGTIITCGIQPTDDGMLFTREGKPNTANFRYIQQQINIVPRYTTILSLSDLKGGDVAAGRTIAGSCIAVFESLFEDVRKSVIKGFGRDVSEQFISMIEDKYASRTDKLIETLFAEINWPLLLEGSECGEQCRTVVNNSLAINPPRRFPLRYNGVTNIPPLPPPAKFNLGSLADMKATMLLKLVCGDNMYDYFLKYGHIITESEGYTFKITPGRWIHVTDYNGKTAELCIHTRNYSCNVIDEVVIAYLHIKDDVFSYMKTANVFHAQQGFNRSGIGLPSKAEERERELAGAA